MNLKKKGLIIISILVVLTTLLFGSYQVVKANDIMPFAHYDPSAVSFYGTYTGTSNYYDGNYMVCEANATSADGVTRDIVIEVEVIDTNKTYKYVCPSDGNTRKTPNIPINGGSSVKVSAYCSDSSVKITLDLKMYSFQ